MVDHITMVVMATIMKAAIAVTMVIDMTAMTIMREGNINLTLVLPSPFLLLRPMKNL